MRRREEEEGRGGKRERRERHTHEERNRRNLLLLNNYWHQFFNLQTPGNRDPTVRLSCVCACVCCNETRENKKTNISFLMKHNNNRTSFLLGVSLWPTVQSLLDVAVCQTYSWREPLAAGSCDKPLYVTHYWVHVVLSSLMGNTWHSESVLWANLNEADSWRPGEGNSAKLQMLLGIQNGPFN